MISSHILSELEVLSDRVGIMEQGALLAEKGLEEVKSDGKTLESYFRKVTGGVGIA
ncbi:hypothetical protein EVA_05778 [gut metagenome]|uniref:ABC transporter, ATP-binding protein n=1 Tax=gut metagenome TaxID=749906 RepID=J9D0N6_9ZZZZ